MNGFLERKKNCVFSYCTDKYESRDKKKKKKRTVHDGLETAMFKTSVIHTDSLGIRTKYRKLLYRMEVWQKNNRCISSHSFTFFSEPIRQCIMLNIRGVFVHVKIRTVRDSSVSMTFVYLWLQMQFLFLECWCMHYPSHTMHNMQGGLPLLCLFTEATAPQKVSQSALGQLMSAPPAWWGYRYDELKLSIVQVSLFEEQSDTAKTSRLSMQGDQSF